MPYLFYPNNMRELNKKYPGLFKYLLLGVLGPLTIIISSLFQNIIIPKEQQGFSYFLNYNFTMPVGTIFFITGVLIGYFWQLNPWKVGLCLFLVFPVTAFIEILIYRGSHNLIPFELLIYFLYALPCIIAVYIGKYISQQRAKRKEKGINQVTNPGT